MDERIKAVRKLQKLTQAAFGKRIGVKGNTVTNYETGLRFPSEAVILSICREFNISERWLRTGEGPMTVDMSVEEEISRFVGEVISGGGEDFRLRYLRFLSRLRPDEWAMLEKMHAGLSDQRPVP